MRKLGRKEIFGREIFSVVCRILFWIMIIWRWRTGTMDVISRVVCTEALAGKLATGQCARVADAGAGPPSPSSTCTDRKFGEAVPTEAPM